MHNNDYRRAEWPSEENECEEDRVFLPRFARLKTGMAGRKRHRFSAFWLRFQFWIYERRVPQVKEEVFVNINVSFGPCGCGSFLVVFGRFLVVYLVSWSFLFVLVRVGRLWSSLVVFGRSWSWSLVVVSLVRPMAAIPFAAQALVGTLPDAVVATLSTNPVTLKELVDEFVRQLPEAAQMISNVMQSSATAFLVHCSSTRHAEVGLHAGLTFRTYPLTFVPAPNAQWVKLTRVVFGTT